MGRRPRFQRRQVEEAALATLDARGADGLTMRAVAESLGTGPMTLYGYIDEGGGLAALAVDAVLRGVRLPADPHPDWREELRAIASAVYAAVRPHPHAIALILARRSGSAGFLEVAERLLAALARSGREGEELLIAFRAVTTLATAFALTELGGPLARQSGDTTLERFAALPAHRYPRLLEIAAAARASDPEREFARSLDALIAGLAASS